MAILKKKVLEKLLKGAKKKQVERIYKLSGIDRKSQIDKFYRKENSDSIVDHYQKLKVNRDRDVLKWEQEVNRVTRKIMRRKNLSSNDRELLETHRAFFTRTHEFKNVNSSWIISVRYLKRSQTLYVRMVRGKLDYPFYDVPFWVYAFLTTLPAGSGKWWWDKGIGIRFSSNPENWVRKNK